MKRLAQQLGLLLAIVAAGTLIDWVVHSSRDAWYVEPSYFTGKIVYGVAWGLFAVVVLRRVLAVTNPRVLALGVPAIISIVLQTKYFYQGRNLDFIILFLFLHYLMFVPPALFVFSRYREIFLVEQKPGKRRWGLFIAIMIGLEAMFYLYFRLFPPFV